jgi:hypothetical protein
MSVRINMLFAAALLIASVTVCPAEDPQTNGATVKLRLSSIP